MGLTQYKIDGTSVPSHVPTVNVDCFNRLICEKLRERVKVRGLSIDDMARGTGIPRSTMARYLQGKTMIPLHAFVSICSFLDFNMANLIHRALRAMDAEGQR